MNYKEIEYKYWADSYSKEDFQAQLSSSCDDIAEPIYVVSCDDYYLRDCDSEQSFVRFRKGGGIYELTLKRKEQENVVRNEINLNVTANDDSAIVEFLSLSGYRKEFQVYKEAWIWNVENCVLSYYTLSDGRSVIELESENYKTVDEGISIINHWEELLGLKSLKKESRSLYEIFTEERESNDS
jgi:adenylate cyclase class IV